MAKKVERTRNNGTWTEAEFNARIVAALRKVSMFWKPKNECIKKARVGVGKYRCEQCKQVVNLSLIHI